MFGAVLVLVFLSGLTGLIYQVTWQKYLSIYLGSHAFATALVLGVFFLFLSLGYFAAGRYSARLMKNKLLLYGVVELVIGLYGLVSSEIFHFLNDVLSIHTESTFTTVLLGLVFSSLFIGFPTFLMGATIPVLTLGLSKNVQESHKTHALIYGVNTLGAFLGTVIAGFWMIEEFGLPLTLAIVGLLNILIFLGTAAISRNHPDAFDGCETAKADKPSLTPEFKKQVRLSYVISFLSGVYVFTIESLIIRMAGVAIGSSTYTYTIVVAAFIFSIGFGSVVVSRLTKWSPAKSLLVSQSILIAFAIATYQLIPLWPQIFLRIRLLIQPSHMNFELYWVFIFILFLILLVPFVIFMGMNLPLMFGHLRHTGPIGTVTGRLYGVNCLGSFIGAVFGGYIAYNYFEVHTVFRFAIILIIISAAILMSFAVKFNKIFFAALCAITFAVLLLPSWPRQAFTPALYMQMYSGNETKDFQQITEKNKKDSAQFKFLQSYTDPGTLVDIVEFKGEQILFLNGKADAVSTSDAVTRALAALIPLSIAPYDVENVFISGLGAGLSASIATQYKEVKSVDVAEISRGVIDALPYFDKFNANLLNERQHKLSIYLGDAYKILKDSTKKYDVMICESTHLWVSGVEKLYTVDFYRTAASKLRDDGIYVQWLPPFNVDNSTLISLISGFRQAFPYSSLWNTGSLALVGSKKPIHLDRNRLLERFNELSPIYKSVGFNTPYSILVRQILSDAAVAALHISSTELHTLENPLLEYQAGRTFFAGTASNLNELLNTFNTTLAFYPNTENRFLLDSIWGEMPKEAILDTLNSTKRFNIGPYEDRLNLLLYKKDAKIFSSADPNFQVFFDALTSEKNVNTPSLLIDKNLEALGSALNLLFNANQKINFSLFARAFNPNCNDQPCLKTKLKIVLNLSRPKHKLAAKNIIETTNWQNKAEAINRLYQDAFDLKN